MAIIDRLIIGFVKGVGGPDLDDWIEDLPGKAGEKLGELIRRNLDSAGILTTAGENELRALLKEDKGIATDVMSAILEKESGGLSNDSIIPSYLEVLNTIVKVVRDRRHPLVLRGFFCILTIA